MTNSKTFILLNKMTVKVRILFIYIILNLLSEIANDKNKVLYTCLVKLINNNENGFSGKRINALGCV